MGKDSFEFESESQRKLNLENSSIIFPLSTLIATIFSEETELNLQGERGKQINNSLMKSHYYLLSTVIKGCSAVQEGRWGNSTSGVFH